MKKRVKINRESEHMARARHVLKSDSTGIAVEAESIIADEVKRVLNEFFLLSGGVSVNIRDCENGLLITLKANAKSVKDFKIV